MYLEVCFFIIIYIRQYYWFSPCLAQLTLGESEGISWNFMELEETDFFFFFFFKKSAPVCFRNLVDCRKATRILVPALKPCGC